MPLRVIPVLDVKGGQAVHAVAGQREHYGPIQSILHATSDPIGLARAYRDVLGLTAVYLADLDAINGAPANLAVYRALADLGLELWVDAGLRVADQVDPLLSSGVTMLIAGLETVAGPAALAAIVDRAGPERVAFSLDLRDRQPLCAPDATWKAVEPTAIVAEALLLGVRRLIVLDLARVGTGTGVGTLALLRQLANAYPNVELIAGGGIAGRDDLSVLEHAGTAAVLVASALHDGRITANDMK
jgi:phosphoribosylformimino-5-aminoimidazole carboxamide ribotide isomerase